MVTEFLLGLLEFGILWAIGGGITLVALLLTGLLSRDLDQRTTTRSILCSPLETMILIVLVLVLWPAFLVMLLVNVWESLEEGS